MLLGISVGQDSNLVGQLAQLAVDELNEAGGTNRYSFVDVRLLHGVQVDAKMRLILLSLQKFLRSIIDHLWMQI